MDEDEIQNVSFTIRLLTDEVASLKNELKNNSSMTNSRLSKIEVALLNINNHLNITNDRKARQKALTKEIMNGVKALFPTAKFVESVKQTNNVMQDEELIRVLAEHRIKAIAKDDLENDLLVNWIWKEILRDYRSQRSEFTMSLCWVLGRSYNIRFLQERNTFESSSFSLENKRLLKEHLNRERLEVISFRLLQEMYSTKVIREKHWGSDQRLTYSDWCFVLARLRAFLEGRKTIEQADMNRELLSWPGQTEESEIADDVNPLAQSSNTAESNSEQESLLAELQTEFDHLTSQWHRRTSASDSKSFVTQFKALQECVPENDRLFEELRTDVKERLGLLTQELLTATRLTQSSSSSNSRSPSDLPPSVRSTSRRSSSTANQSTSSLLSFRLPSSSSAKKTSQSQVPASKRLKKT